jgi:nucleotide-binding universal stress UspA family protein
MADGPRSLVVGLDGSKSALVALDWAAAEAAERNWPRRLPAPRTARAHP